jgi:hypothetical protein
VLLPEFFLTILLINQCMWHTTPQLLMIRINPPMALGSPSST